MIVQLQLQACSDACEDCCIIGDGHASRASGEPPQLPSDGRPTTNIKSSRQQNAAARLMLLTIRKSLNPQSAWLSWKVVLVSARQANASVWGLCMR